MSDSDLRSIQISIPAADADYVATTQTPVGAGNLTLTSSTVTLSPAQKISITSDGNESARTFVVTGTTIDGAAQTENFTGPNATTTNGTKYFATVTNVSISGAGTGNITVGVVLGGARTVARASAGGRCRVRGVHYYNAGSAGTLLLRDGSLTTTSGNTVTLNCGPTTAETVDFMGPILFRSGCYIELTSAPITGATIFYEGAR